MKNLRLWDQIEKFELGWTMKVSAYIYNKELVINKLKSTIRENILSDVENIDFINTDSLRITNVISKNTAPLNVKITAEIEVFYSHNFLSKQSNYTEKLKNTISGIHKKWCSQVSYK